MSTDARADQHAFNITHTCAIDVPIGITIPVSHTVTHTFTIIEPDDISFSKRLQELIRERRGNRCWLWWNRLSSLQGRQGKILLRVGRLRGNIRMSRAIEKVHT